MSRVTIKQKNDQGLLDLLIKLLGCVAPSGKGIDGVNNIISFDQYLMIFDSLVSINGYEELDPEKMRIIKAAIFRLATYKKQSIAYFKRAIEAELRFIQRRSKREFYVVFPTLVNPESLSGTQHFSLGQNTIEVRNLAKTGQKVEIDTAIKESLVHMPIRTSSFLKSRKGDITYLILIRTTFDGQQALNDAQKVMDLFRGIVTFSLTRNTYHWQGGPPHPLAHILPFPLYYVFDRSGGLQDYWVGWPLPTRYYVRSLSDRGQKDIKRLIGLFEQGLEDGNLTEKILDPMLRKYGLASGQQDRGLVFLYLWQILEVVALGGEGQLPDTKKKKRIKALLANDLQRNVFKCLYRRRNLLVHEGKFGVRLEDEINALKSLCDYSISFLFDNLGKINDLKDLDYYLQNVRLEEIEKKRKMRILREMLLV